MSIRKFTDYVNECYEMDLDNGDISEEHAKEVIANFISGENNGVSLQDAYDQVAEANLVGMSDDTFDNVIESVNEYADKLKRMASGLVNRH